MMILLDKTGLDLCRSQTSPCPSSRDDTYLYFNVNVELQIPLEEMHKGTKITAVVLKFSVLVCRMFSF